MKFTKPNQNIIISGLYYKPMTIENDDSRVINKLETSLTDDARVIIYDRHVYFMLISCLCVCQQ